MTKRLTLVAVVLCAAGVSVPPGAAAAGSPVVADCTTHGRLTQHYTVNELHAALTEIPTDVQEYTNCYALIQRALLAQVSGSRPDAGNASQGSSGGSFLPVPVIVVLAVLAAGAAGFGVYSLRSR